MNVRARAVNKEPESNRKSREQEMFKARLYFYSGSQYPILFLALNKPLFLARARNKLGHLAPKPFEIKYVALGSLYYFSGSLFTALTLTRIE